MNMAVLERYAPLRGSASPGEWLSVVGVFAAIAAVALVLLIVMYWRAGRCGTASEIVP